MAALSIPASRQRHLALCLATVLILLGCGGTSSGRVGPTSEASSSPKDEAAAPASTAGEPNAIKSVYAPFFEIGVAVGPAHLETVGDIIETHFNRLTAENDMKGELIHPADGVWNFGPADLIADYARQHQMKMTGHTLLWHRMQPAWWFSDLTPKDPGSIETLRQRLKEHITTVVTRYADVVDHWDVVNEAISDNPDAIYRDGGEGSKWFEIYGDESYLYDAFRFAREALESATGSAEGKLYYNDYNVTQKLDKILKLVTWLKDEKGIPLDGVGFQAHWNLEWPPLNEIQSAIDRLVAAGLRVKISELDLSIYPKDDWATKTWEPEKPFTEELEAIQAERFADLFALFRKNKGVITSVTLWGVTDDATWLDSFPAGKRNNHPLLFDEAHQPKSAVEKILAF